MTSTKKKTFKVGREREIQSAIISYLNDHQIFNFKIVSANKRGIPDLFVLYHGKAIFFEIKANQYAKISELQKYQMQQIESQGGKAFRVNTLEEFKNILANEDFIFAKESGHYLPGDYQAEYEQMIAQKASNHAS